MCLSFYVHWLLECDCIKQKSCEMIWLSVWILRGDITFIVYGRILGFLFSSLADSTCLCVWLFECGHFVLCGISSSVKGNNRNSPGFQVLEFPSCFSPCLHPAVFVPFRADQRCQPDTVQVLGCDTNPDPHLCACFSSNNQIPINEQIHSVQWMFLVLQIQTNFPGSPWNISAVSVCLAARLCCLAVEGQLLQVRAPHKVLPHLDGQRLDSENSGFPVDVSFQPARDEFHCKHCKGLCSLLHSTALFYPLILPFNRL